MTRIALAVVLLCAPSALAHVAPAEHIHDLDGAIEARPTDGALHLRRGELHREAGRFEAALADYARAAELLPDDAVVEFCVGRALLESGRAAAALPHLEGYLGCRPDDVQARRLTAEALALQGRVVEAVRVLDETIALHDPHRPPPPELFLKRAALLQLSDPGAALASLDEGLDWLGPVVTLELAAIDIALAQREWDEALRRVDAVLDRLVRRETWLVRRAEILESAGRSAQARRVWVQARHALEAVPPARAHAPAARKLSQKIQARLSDGESSVAKRTP